MQLKLDTPTTISLISLSLASYQLFVPKPDVLQSGSRDDPVLNVRVNNGLMFSGSIIISAGIIASAIDNNYLPLVMSGIIIAGLFIITNYQLDKNYDY